MKNRMLAFGIANISASLSMILLDILFVSVFQLREQALILSSLLSNGLQLLILFLFVRRTPKKEELDSALKEALSANGPVVVECVIDDDDKVFPMVSPGASIRDAFDASDLEKG